jgi:hypothetical protein
MNFMISVLGWFLWNWINFNIEKSELDDDGDDKTNLSLHEYKNRHWPNWIGSLMCVPLLLWVGSRQLSLDPFASVIGMPGVGLGWNDVYLIGSGALYEILIFAVKRIKKIFKKKASDL